jgi:hypothetical protein
VKLVVTVEVVVSWAEFWKVSPAEAREAIVRCRVYYALAGLGMALEATAYHDTGVVPEHAKAALEKIIAQAEEEVARV